MTNFLDCQFGMKEEVTFGTAVVPDRFYLFNADPTHTDGPVISQASALTPGARIEQEDLRATIFHSASGDLSLNLPSKGMGVLWKACMGSGDSNLVSTGLYQQVFTWADVMPSYTTQYGVFDGTAVSPYTYSGCQIGGWTLNCPEGDFVNMSINWVGKALSTAGTIATASYPAGAPRFTFAHAEFYAGGTLTAATTTALASVTGSALATVKSFSITQDNALKEGPQSGGYPTRRKPGQRSVTGTVSVEYDGNTLRDAIVADTSIALLVTLTNGTDVLQIVVPKVRLGGSPLPTSKAGDRITHDLAFKGLTTNPTVVVRTADAAL